MGDMAYGPAMDFYCSTVLPTENLVKRVIGTDLSANIQCRVCDELPGYLYSYQRKGGGNRPYLLIVHMSATALKRQDFVAPDAPTVSISDRGSSTLARILAHAQQYGVSYTMASTGEFSVFVSPQNPQDSQHLVAAPDFRHDAINFAVNSHLTALERAGIYKPMRPNAAFAQLTGTNT